MVGEQLDGSCADKVPSSQANSSLGRGIKAYLNSPDQAKQGEMQVDVETAEKQSKNNLMRSGNSLESVGKPNQTVYTKKKAASTHSLDQYKNESCTAKKKSLVREAILKFSENSDGAKAFAPPEAECKDKNILKNVKNYETKPNRLHQKEGSLNAQLRSV